MKKLYVISGSAGMTGSQLVKELVKRGEEVLGFDNFFASSVDNVFLSDTVHASRYHFFEADICHDLGRIENQLIKYSDRKLIFINCAAIVHTRHFYNIKDTFNVNVVGMQKFLDLAIRLKAHTFINCSTSEVYSARSYANGGVKESEPISLLTASSTTRTSYATGKLLTEFFAKDAHDRHRMKTCSLRFANVYSEFESESEHIIPHIVDSLIKDAKVTLMVQAQKTYRTFLHNEDSCNAVLDVIDNAPLTGEVYNVGTDEEILIPDLVAMIANLMGIKKYEIVYDGYRDADPQRRLLDCHEIRTHAGWAPKVTLEEGLKRVINARMNRKHY